MEDRRRSSEPLCATLLSMEALDQRWTPLLFTAGIPLVVLGVVLRSVSTRRSFPWRLGDAALYLGFVFLSGAVALHFIVPYVEAKFSEAFELPGS